MKCLVLTLVSLLSFARIVSGSDWSTNYEEAVQEAKAQNKMILLDFTGSDWCGYCKLLDEEVFAQAEFRNYVNKTFLLVSLDFPRKNHLPEGLQEQNSRLARQYAITGFPTLILLDSQGQELGRIVGYTPKSGPNELIRKLEEFQ